MNKTLLILIFAALTITAAQLPKEMSFKPYGLVQYRLRYDFLYNDVSDVTTSSGSYSNTISYKVGLKATLNDKVSTQFELGNDWGATETTDALSSNFYKKRNFYSPWFSLAFLRFDPGFLHIEAGIVPVNSTTTADLLGASLYNNKNYTAAAHLPWIVITNSSIQGLRLGAPILKGDFKFGIDVLTSVISQRPVVAKDDFNINADALMVMVDLPVSYKIFKLSPQFIALPYRNYDKIKKEKDTEFMAGFDCGIQANKSLSLRFGYAVAVFEQNVINDTASGETVQTDRIGMIGGLGLTAIFGPGKLDFDVKLSSDNNLKIDNSKILYPYLDLIYAIKLNKYFAITPRIRMFITSKEDNLRIITRPDLIFNTAF
jgi:hypothetical protein